MTASPGPLNEPGSEVGEPLLVRRRASSSQSQCGSSRSGADAGLAGYSGAMLPGSPATGIMNVIVVSPLPALSARARSPGASAKP